MRLLDFLSIFALFVGLSGLTVACHSQSDTTELQPPLSSQPKSEYVTVEGSKVRQPGIQAPKIEGPQVTIPEVQAPEITFPEITFPEITFPGIRIQQG